MLHFVFSCPSCVQLYELSQETVGESCSRGEGGRREGDERKIQILDSVSLETFSSSKKWLSMTPGRGAKSQTNQHTSRWRQDSTNVLSWAWRWNCDLLYHQDQGYLIQGLRILHPENFAYLWLFEIRGSLNLRIKDPQSSLESSHSYCVFLISNPDPHIYARECT